MPATPSPQQTILRPVTLSGRGMFFGKTANVTFKPAPSDHGVVFCRTDLGGATIPAQVAYAVKRARRSGLRLGQATVDTCEHCLSAVSALGIENLRIEIDAPELPGLDGSAKPYVESLSEAGRRDCDRPRHPLVVTDPVMVRLDESTLAAVPSQQPGLEIVYELDYPTELAIGHQVLLFRLGVQDYAREIAPARTFVLEHEARALQSGGFGTHLGPADMLVIGKRGPLPPNQWRFPDEAVRHKVQDLIGDLALAGVPIQGKIIAIRSGHALNQSLVRALLKQFKQQTRQALATGRPIFDIRALSRILPHRYPMLLVDRVIEIDGERRALGIKNVTINEPFFHGHFPTAPIMPGVLIVEAMAQLSGMLIGQRLENQGKLAILLSLDRVKLRRPVVPGDQLMLEAEAVRLRSSVAHTRCRAYVGQEIAAEAEVKFMIVDQAQL
jgi:UDP-3-O-[3-hydroxymyristoyl] N-acetylglucosamine deacetylase/3-hydroxyacyl-[acyl-carrier-protein] dehydratase